ncbi:hypothetical protein [Nocardia terpenica]|uniref:Uncharacterized protein n=1 Tax=Nocardia terpenica TaxID=455432 RepID=A0A164HVE9_9NOCA|nr:hypothetical protein [Nocardia terpenica]KZM68854.1 hypothetical protein AWN90_13780 [Nocardia terpenica]NQE88102.1 hypothetical protein [Nocardia terpenica]
MSNHTDERVASLEAWAFRKDTETERFRRMVSDEIGPILGALADPETKELISVPEQFGEVFNRLDVIEARHDAHTGMLKAILAKLG